MIGGQVAMIMNYFAFFPALVNPEHQCTTQMSPASSPIPRARPEFAKLPSVARERVSFPSPARSVSRPPWTSSSGSPRKMSRPKWAELGGYTCNTNVLTTDAFMNATPYNPAFAETMTFVKDFWNIPAYGRVAGSLPRELPERFVVGGEGTAKEAMDTIAAEQTAALKADRAHPVSLHCS